MKYAIQEIFKINAMSKFKLIFGFLLVLFFGQGIQAQNATFRGQMIDQETTEPVPFANIYIEELGTGDVSDLDGFFSFDLEPGTYNIVFSYVGYNDYKLKDLVLAPGAEEVMTIQMGVGIELDEVVVTAEETRSSIVGITTLRNKANQMLDAIPAELIKQAGDGDAGEAIKRVSGVSVEGGKHVFVRGLGDRYTKTTLNGMDIPGLDPDRNSVELDIFPTNLVENIIVYKNFTPDLSGDFTGGNVDITTKSFPDRKTTDLSVSLGFNPSMHFNSNFVGYQGGQTDFLGFDDGGRALPFHPLTKIIDPSQTTGPELFNITNSFSKTMSAQRVGNGMNTGFGFSTGNQINKQDLTIGYNLSLSYKNNSTFYEGNQYNLARYSNDADDFNLEQTQTGYGDVGQNDVFWSAMAGAAVKWKQHKFTLNALRLQNGTRSAAEITTINGFENPATLLKDNLEYAQREVTNFLLKGSHALSEGKHKIDWSLSPTIIQVDEPDIRFSAWERLPDGTLQQAPAVGAITSRTFRNLEEQSLAGKANYTLEFDQWSDLESKFKFGVAATRKMRTFDIQNYLVRVRNQGSLDLNGNPDALFATENILNSDDEAGTFIKGNFQPSNNFEATAQVLAAYVMNELPITSKLNMIYGVRLEKADNYYTGENNQGNIEYNNEKVLDDLDLLPSLNLVYKLKEKMNLRGSYSRTLARPSFKEKSIAQIQDRISGIVFNGNIDLVSTNIDNADIRWEAFGKKGQSVSVSSFYKAFKNPIELVIFDATAPDNFQPVNVGNASVLGLEFEGRKNLDFISPRLNGFSIATNITVVKSQVEMKEQEYEARKLAARTGQTIEKTRAMVGQSPFIVNASMAYKSLEKGWEANLSYNVQGERLAVAGIGYNPDIFEKPFHSLNFKAGKSFGKDDRMKASLAVGNILGSKRHRVYNGYNTESTTFQLFDPGRIFNLGFSYKLN